MEWDDFVVLPCLWARGAKGFGLKRVKQLSLAGLRLALLWSYCATARSLIKRLQINSDSSS